MTSVTIPGEKLSPLVADVGTVVGLLAASGSDYAFDLDWFGDPVTRFRAIPGQRTAILKLLRDALGKTDANAPADRSWYQLPWKNAPTPIYLVIPKDDSGTSSDVGFGIFDNFNVGTFKARHISDRVLEVRPDPNLGHGDLCIG